ncbi:MAG: ABC transporter permease [Oscillospiraceae bacterium]|nr:ABC transporter permease [Oscillospiraceae bacterium]
MITILVSVFLLLLAVASVLFFRHVTGMLPSQQAAARWSPGGDRVAQVTAYIPEHNGLTHEATRGVIHALRSGLMAEGIDPGDADGGGVWTYAYSAQEVLRLSSRYRGPAVVYATGVGGNFFLFNPVLLISGSYFPRDSINRDMVLLDETLAWWLFGAVDVAGMTVYIGGVPHVISGVYRPYGDFASQAATGDMPHMFLFYDALAAEVGFAPITNVQAVLPNPVSGLAEEFLAEAMESANLKEGEYALINNTERYTLSAMIDVVQDFGSRAMRQMGFSLPQWENAARMAEDFAALALVLTLLFLVFPTITALRLIIRRWRRRKWRLLRGTWNWWNNRREGKREDAWRMQNQEAEMLEKEKDQYNLEEIIRSVRESEENHEKEN